MQTIHLPSCFAKHWNTRIIDSDSLSDEARKRQAGLTLWHNLRYADGMTSKRALTRVMGSFGHSAKYWYRWRDRLAKDGPKGLNDQSRKPKRIRTLKWDVKFLDAIVAIRSHEDTCRWGPAKIYHQCKRDTKATPSIATIARMIRFLKDKGKITRSRIKSRVRPTVREYAQRYRPSKHKELRRIQIDVDSYVIDGKNRYIFNAIHVPTRYGLSRCYSRVTARCGRDFLEHVLASIPTKIVYDYIQVDGGSEFKAEFEQELKKRGIPLLVNRPHTPKQNAFVERFNRTIDEECMQVYFLQ